MNPPRQIGSFEILARLGAGGMGEVYRARDPRLNREVAIKVLPESAARDAQALRRMEQEARAVAALNHPNLLSIYETGQTADGSPYMVTELLQGESLRERLRSAAGAANAALDQRKAIDYATQIALGLAAAHDRGITHRDLKPENIFLTRDGQVKILDFGLAKLSAAAVSEEVTVAEAGGAATAPGVVLGTVGYMSPEQVRGQAVDARSDIFSFGAVLYEMLSGRRAFRGDSAADVMSAVLNKEPEPLTAPSSGSQAAPAPALDRALDRIVRHCLEKEPRQRFQSAGDIAFQLGDLNQATTTGGLPALAAAPRRRSPGPVARLLLLAGAVAAVIAAVLLTWWLKPQPPPAGAVRFSYTLAAGQGFWRPGRHVVAISPDGANIVYTENAHLYLRPLDTLDAHVIQGTAPDLYDPVFSPDGKWIAYIDPSPHDVLQKIPVSGGAPVTLCSLGAEYSDLGLSWSGDRIVLGHLDAHGGSAVEAVSAAGGIPQVLATVAQGDLAAQPQLLDHGRRLLFTIVPAAVTSDGTDQIVIQDVGSPASRHVLVTGGTNARLLSGNLLLYVRHGTLFGVRVAPSRRAVTGTPVPLVEGISENGLPPDGSVAAQYSVAGNGTLVYWPGGYLYEHASRLAWVDRQGHETPLDLPVRFYGVPRLSPNGRLVAVTFEDPASGRWDVWIWDTVRSTFTRLTSGPADQMLPFWSPDGRYVYYASMDMNITSMNGSSALYRVAADGAGAAELLAANIGYMDSISPNGKLAVLETGRPRHLVLLPLQPGAKPHRLLSGGAFANTEAAISPDGRWLAYASNETGDWQIYVRPFPNVNAGRWQISMSNGRYPAWSSNGRKLYYEDHSPGHDAIVGVPVHPAGAAFSAGSPQITFSFSTHEGPGGVLFSVAPAGRFLMRLPAASASTAPPSLIVVTNWTQAADARVQP